MAQSFDSMQGVGDAESPTPLLVLPYPKETQTHIQQSTEHKKSLIQQSDSPLSSSLSSPPLGDKSISVDLAQGLRKEHDELSNLDMKIMKLRTSSRQRDVNFFINPVEFLSVKTIENIHIYLWIAKDLSWTQNWYWPGLIFGGLAMLLSFLVCVSSIWVHEYADAWHNFAHLLWLVANFVWMTGDFHDDKYPNSPSVYDSRALWCQYVMIFALGWLALYYLILRPFNVFNEKKDPYCKVTEKSWISSNIFRNWNEYERLHIFFWLLKDFGWNILSEPVWFTGLIPTLSMAINFAWIVANVNGMIVESAHYIAQFMWVLGNAIWAFGELYYGDRDTAFPLFSESTESHITYRWYSSWMLIAAFLPIILVYIVLIAYSLYGYVTGNLSIFQNPVGSNTLLDIHTLNSSVINGRHSAIRQMESDIHASFSVPQGDQDSY